MSSRITVTKVDRCVGGKLMHCQACAALMWTECFDFPLFEVTLPAGRHTFVLSRLCDRHLRELRGVVDFHVTEDR